MNRLALGTVQFGLEYGIANRQGRVSVAAGRQILEQGRKAGMDLLDTAIAYGDSEQRLGEIGTSEWQVVTKLPSVPDGCDDVDSWVSAEVKGSLSRLRRANLSGLLLHRPEQLLSPFGDRLYAALVGVKKDGLVSKIGVSIYDPSELHALRRFRFDIVQAPFNVLDRRLLDTGWLGRLAGEGSELHVRSVFLQGLLLMTPSERPGRFHRWASLWSRWDGWLRDAGVTSLQGCLGFVLSFSEIDRIIVGVDDPQQLRQILEAVRNPVPQPPAELTSLDVELVNPAGWAAL